MTYILQMRAGATARIAGAFVPVYQPRCSGYEVRGYAEQYCRQYPHARIYL